jgi:hypothetical protein
MALDMDGKPLSHNRGGAPAVDFAFRHGV